MDSPTFASPRAEPCLNTADFANRLTPATFEAALNTAIAFSCSLAQPLDIYMPSGVWPMKREVTLPGLGPDRRTPGLLGAGARATTLSWPDNYAGKRIHLDGSTKPVMSPRFADFGITGPAGYGVFARQLRSAQWQRVALTGFDRDGVAFHATDAAGANNQSCHFEDCTFGRSAVGTELRACSGFIFINCQWDRNGYADIVSNGRNFVSIFASQMTSADTRPAIYDGLAFKAIRCEGGLVVGSGTDAQVSAPGDLRSGVTVTGLTGMSPSSVGHTLLLYGIGRFEILAYNTPTSVTVDKIAGNAQAHVSWAEVAYDGNDSLIVTGIYREGQAAPLLQMKQSTAPSTFYLADSVLNLGPAGELVHADSASITLRNLKTDPALVVRARRCTVTTENVSSYVKMPEKYDLDEVSRHALNETGLYPYCGEQSSARSLQGLLKSLAIEIWDTRRVDLAEVVGAQLHSLTGTLAGLKAQPVNAGIYPAWVPSSVSFRSQPTMKIVGHSSSTSVGALQATIPGALAPAGGPIGLFVVARRGAAGNVPTVVRQVGFSDGAGLDIRICFDDVSHAGHISGLLNSPAGKQQLFGPMSADGVAGTRADAWLLQGRPHRPDGEVQPLLSGNGAEYVGAAQDYRSLGAGGIIKFGYEQGLGSAELEIAFVALLKRQLSAGETAQLMGLAALEFGTSE